MKENTRIERKHYVIGALIIVFALTAQPFASLGIQVVLAPKLVALLEKLKTDPFKEFYSIIKLDQDKFAQCKADPSIAAIISDDQKMGESLGVNGTPSTFVGKRNAAGDIVLYKDNISGALPEETVMQTIAATKGKALSTNIIKNKDLHIYGSENAETFLVEFSDFQCPYCTRFHPTINSIVDGSSGKIAYIYKHFPLPFHEKATPLAIDSECIYAQKGNAGFFGFVNVNFAQESI